MPDDTQRKVAHVDPDATDKSPEWHERHPNPSGLPDGHPVKVAQPIPADHHEEGHRPS